MSLLKLLMNSYQVPFVFADAQRLGPLKTIGVMLVPFETVLEHVVIVTCRR